jgi:glycosyltransferase involved in cell wall biosynthesis
MSDLIFFTPMLPFPTGHGSSMRASVILDVLAERHRVFVVHSPIWPSRGIFNEAWVREHAAGYAVLPALPDASAVEQLAATAFPGARFSCLYAFRLAMAPLALRFASLPNNDSLRTVLDLDDDDVARTERFIDLLGRTGEHRQAAIERAALPRLRVHQKMFVPRFEVNLLAGSGECRSLAKQFPEQQFVCLPNIVRPAPCVGPPRDPLSLLFLGSLDYLPNGDAVRYLCQSILPILRAHAPLTRVRIVGQGASPALLALARHEDIDMVGMMPDVTPEYVRAGIVIVPLRAGSGTRIKILEAFSFRRPVVSTSAGAEGLDVKHEKHLLIADTPEEFACACLRLMKDAGLRERLVDSAAAFLAAEHAFDRVRSVLHSIYSA